MLFIGDERTLVESHVFNQPGGLKLFVVSVDSVLHILYRACGEKMKLGFSYLSFAKQIIKNSRVELLMIEDQFQLAKYVKSNIYGKKIVIGMGAGSISSWMRELPKYL